SGFLLTVIDTMPMAEAPLTPGRSRRSFWNSISSSSSPSSFGVSSVAIRPSFRLCRDEELFPSFLFRLRAALPWGGVVLFKRWVGPPTKCDRLWLDRRDRVPTRTTPKPAAAALSVRSIRIDACPLSGGGRDEFARDLIAPKSEYGAGDGLRRSPNAVAGRPAV